MGLKTHSVYAPFEKALDKHAQLLAKKSPTKFETRSHEKLPVRLSIAMQQVVTQDESNQVDEQGRKVVSPAGLATYKGLRNGYFLLERKVVPGQEGEHYRADEIITGHLVDLAAVEDDFDMAVALEAHGSRGVEAVRRLHPELLDVSRVAPATFWQEHAQRNYELAYGVMAGIALELCDIRAIGRGTEPKGFVSGTLNRLAMRHWASALESVDQLGVQIVETNDGRAPMLWRGVPFDENQRGNEQTI